MSDENQNGEQFEPESRVLKVPPLRYLGDKQLMQKQDLVSIEEIQSESFQKKIKMLQQAMKEHGGIGIAAPQIGWWVRVFCFGIDGSNPRYPAAKSIPFTVWINPEITWSSNMNDTLNNKTHNNKTDEAEAKTKTNWMWEGCLSVPGMRGWVERPKEIILRGLDENGNEREPQHLTGLAARIAQHELDHLDGKLFSELVPDPRFLVPQASMDMDTRNEWAENWPSPGSYRTAVGDLSDVK